VEGPLDRTGGVGCAWTESGTAIATKKLIHFMRLHDIDISASS
jgi:hypothetical protein